MIETAFISGTEDRAFLLVDGFWTVWTSSRGGPAHPAQVRAVVNGAGEYRVLHKVSYSEIQEALLNDKKRADALFATLTVLDEELSISTRVLMAEQAEALLEDIDTRSFVVTRLISRPLPTQVVASRHSLMHVAKNFPELGAILRDVFDLQPRVWEVDTLFKNSAASVAVSADDLSTLVSELMDVGFFASIVRALGSADSHKANTILVTELLRTDPSSPTRALLLDFQRRSQTLFSKGEASQRRQGHLLKRRIHVEPSSMADEYQTNSDESRFSFAQARLSSFKAKERVDKQLQQIRGLLFAGKLQLAERYIKELLEFQLEREEKEYAAMSLCNLGASALEANQVDFAEALVENSMELAPNDIVPFTARAEVYRAQGNFAASLAMFDEVLSRFTVQSTYALNGKANVLAEMGRFEEASALFRQVQQEFPDHPVAFNGEVALLHRRGDHRTALKLALRNAKRFSLDSVTRGVLAGALSRNGKYPDAVRHYQEAWRLDKTNLRFVSGAALAMRSSGRASDALIYIDSQLRENSGSLRILTTKALILRALKRFDEARKVYESVLEVFPAFALARIGLVALDVLQDVPVDLDFEISPNGLHSELDWQGFRTVLVSLIKTGRAEEAAQRISDALPLCPWWDQRVRLATVLGIAQMHANDARSIQTLQNGLDLLDDRQKQGRLLLLSHAQIKGNNRQVGQMLARNIVITRDSELQRIRGQILSLVSKNSDQSATLLTDELEYAMAA